MSRVCVFGDSIVWGAWDPIDGGWVGRLGQAGCSRVDLSDPNAGTYTSVFNCGIGGDKLADLLARLDGEAIARVPEVIVLAIGINDVPHNEYSGTPIEQFRHNYTKLIAMAQGHAQDVVVVTPTNVDEARSEHNFQNSDIEVLAGVVRACANHGNRTTSIEIL